MSRARSSSGPLSSLSVLFEGEKLIWSVSTTIKILLVEHTSQMAIEIIGYDPDKRTEAPHLYVRTDRLDHFIANSADKDSPASSPSISGIQRNQNDKRISILMSRLDIMRKYSNGRFMLKLRADNGENLNGLLCDKPETLVPVLEYFSENGSMKEYASRSRNSTELDGTGTVATTDSEDTSRKSRESPSRSIPGGMRGRRSTTGSSTVFQQESSIESEQSVIRNFSIDDSDVELGTENSISSKLWRTMRSTFFTGGGDSPSSDEPQNGFSSTAVAGTQEHNTGSSPRSRHVTSIVTVSALDTADPTGNKYSDLLLKSIDEEEELQQERMRQLRQLSSVDDEKNSNAKNSSEKQQQRPRRSSRGSFGSIANLIGGRNSRPPNTATAAPDSGNTGRGDQLDADADVAGGVSIRRHPHEQRITERRKSYSHRRTRMLGTLGITKHAHDKVSPS